MTIAMVSRLSSNASKVCNGTSLGGSWGSNCMAQMESGQRCQLTCTGDTHAVGYFRCMGGLIFGSSICVHDDADVTIHNVQKLGASISVAFKTEAFTSPLQSVLLDAVASSLEVSIVNFTLFEVSKLTPEVTCIASYRRLIIYELLVPPSVKPTTLHAAAVDLLNVGSEAWQRLDSAIRGRSKSGKDSPFCLESVVPATFFSDTVARKSDGRIVTSASGAASNQPSKRGGFLDSLVWFGVVAAGCLLFGFCGGCILSCGRWCQFMKRLMEERREEQTFSATTSLATQASMRSQRSVRSAGTANLETGRDGLTPNCGKDSVEKVTDAGADDEKLTASANDECQDYSWDFPFLQPDTPLFLTGQPKECMLNSVGVTEVSRWAPPEVRVKIKSNAKEIRAAPRVGDPKG